MQPLPPSRPVRWFSERPSFTVKVSLAELTRNLGAPHARDEEGGAGRVYQWGFRCDCGLELLVDYERASQEASVRLEHLEVEHALAHLGLGTDTVTWRLDAEEFLPLEGWAVIRQDAHGNRFDICVLPLDAHAECLAAHMATRAQERSYSVEIRGTPSQVELSRREWTALRRAGSGNRRERSYFAEPATGP
jgi:hypothetical protein